MEGTENGENIMLVSSITPHGGRAIGISPITALVGPNNAGKTAFLQDILQLLTFQYQAEQEGSTDSSQEIETLVVDDMELNPDLNKDDMLSGLRLIEEPGLDSALQGMGPDGCSGLRVAVTPDTFKVLHRPRLAARAVARSELARMLPLRVAMLSLENRLVATKSDLAGSPLETPANLLQLLHLAGRQVQERLNDACQFIFEGDPIWLDDSEIVKLSLRTGPKPTELPEDLASRASVIGQHRLLDDDGHGLRSCVAIILNLLLGQGRLILLDQPELFLHPAQAMRFGRWIARNIEDLQCQVVLSTHSSDFLTGVATHDASQLSILRLSRDEEHTVATTIESMMFEPIVETACSRHDLMQSLFGCGVVLVDNNDDYRIAKHLTHRHLGQSQVAVCQCQDQSIMGQVAGMLRRARLPTVVCTRFDLLAKKTRFTRFVEDITNKDFATSWLGVREKVARQMEQPVDAQAMASNTREMEQFLDGFNGGNDVSTTLPELGQNTRWYEFSRLGLDLLPDDLQAWVNQMVEELKVQGIFIAPRGTLSSWWEAETAIQPINRQLAQLDEGNCPPELREFVTNMNDYLVVQRSM